MACIISMYLPIIHQKKKLVDEYAVQHGVVEDMHVGSNHHQYMVFMCRYFPIGFSPTCTYCMHSCRFRVDFRAIRIQHE